MYLKHSEYVPYAVPHSTVRVEHCRVGKEKLYITHFGDRIVANCYHCGQKGFHFLEPQIYHIGAVKENTSWQPLPADLVALNNPIPEWVVRWLDPIQVPYNILTDKYRLEYSTDRDIVVVPLSGNNYQERRNREPKAVTRVRPEWTGIVWYETYPIKFDYSNTIVLVEDPLSAIMIDYHCRKLSVSSVGLLSYKLHNKLRDMLLQSVSSNIIVWLDNDNPDVVRSAECIQQQLGLVRDVKVVRCVGEPKKHNVQFVINTIRSMV